MTKLWIHPIIFTSKKVGVIDSLFGMKRKIVKMFRTVNGTGLAPGLPWVELNRVRPGIVCAT